MDKSIYIYTRRERSLSRLLKWEDGEWHYKELHDMNCTMPSESATEWIELGATPNRTDERTVELFGWTFKLSNIIE